MEYVSDLGHSGVFSEELQQAVVVQRDSEEHALRLQKAYKVLGQLALYTHTHIVHQAATGQVPVGLQQRGQLSLATGGVHSVARKIPLT